MSARAGVILVALLVALIGVLAIVNAGLGLYGRLVGLQVDLGLLVLILWMVLAGLLLLAAIGLVQGWEWALAVCLVALTLLLFLGVSDFLASGLRISASDAALLGLEVVALVYLVTVRDEFV